MSKFSQFNPAIKSLDYHPMTGNLLVGTRGCEIYEID